VGRRGGAGKNSAGKNSGDETSDNTNSDDKNDDDRSDDGERKTPDRRKRRGDMYINKPILATAFRILLVAAATYGVALSITQQRDEIANMLSYYTIQSNLIVIAFFIALLCKDLIGKKRRALPSVSECEAGQAGAATASASGQKGSVPPSASEGEARARRAFPWQSVKGAVTLAITITFVIFHFVLRPILFTMGSATNSPFAEGGYFLSTSNFLVHYATPIMTLADWLLFTPKGEWRKLDPLKWLGVPLAYFIFSLIRAPFAHFADGSRYPYFFIDVDRYGALDVTRNVLIIAIAFALLGYILLAIDHLLAKASKKRQSTLLDSYKPAKIGSKTLPKSEVKHRQSRK
jgi:hypothetical protein